MKALTICEPWATLIAQGVKRIENRTWRTHYRGPLAIHAGKSRSHWRAAAADPTAWLAQYHVPLPSRESCAFGSVVAIATLIDVVPLAELPDDLRSHPFAEGPWCWILADVRRLEIPIVCKGQLNLWNLAA